MLRGVLKHHRRLCSGLMQATGTGAAARTLASLCFHYHYKTIIVDKAFVSVLKHVTGQAIFFLDWNNSCFVSEGIDD